MAGSKRSKAKNRKDGGGYTSRPDHIFKANLFHKTAPPVAILSHMAARLLNDLCCQFNGFNNGDICAAAKILKLYGWRSNSSINNALAELIALGFLEQTRQGGRNKCSLYALTWQAIDECKAELDVSPTVTPSNLWKPENKDQHDWRFVERFDKRQQKNVAKIIFCSRYTVQRSRY
ncbi:MAG: hypothetical protein ABL903_02045 [Methylococcales bacterium]